MLFTTRADVGAHESLAAFTIRGELGVERDCECFDEWSARKVNWDARKFPRGELMQSVANVSHGDSVVAASAQRQICEIASAFVVDNFAAWLLCSPCRRDASSKAH
jgi:hypothetical protein